MKKQKQKKITVGKLIYTLAPILSVVLLLLGWTLLSYYKGNIIASPVTVVKKIVSLCTKKLSNEYIWGHALVSIRRILIALFLGIITGIPVGIMMGWSRAFRGTIGTLIEMIRPIPALAWIPLFVMWMGIGETPRVVMVYVGTLMPIVVNSYTGVKLVSPLYLDVGKMFNTVSGLQTLWNIVIPAALPAIFAGIRNAVSVAWMVVLAAEMLAAQSGLGFLINRGMTVFDVALIMTGMVLIGILGALLTAVVNFIERKVCPWNTSLQMSD